MNIAKAKGVKGRFDIHTNVNKVILEYYKKVYDYLMKSPKKTSREIEREVGLSFKQVQEFLRNYKELLETESEVREITTKSNKTKKVPRKVYSIKCGVKWEEFERCNK